MEKLKELLDIAAVSGNRITTEEVGAFFGDSELSEEQMLLVYDYLLTQKISVVGYMKGQELTEKAEKETAAAYTPEEKEYLEEYLETFGNTEGFDREQLFQELRQGADVKEQILKSYQKELVQIAKELHSGEIFFGDLLQEGNMGLLMALERAAEQEEIHTWLVNEIRSTIRLFLEEQNQQKKEDDILVEKVRNLEARVKELTEDEDVKYSVEELAVFLDMDVEEMESVLRLTGDDK